MEVKLVNLIKEFEEINLNYYLVLFNATIQMESLGKIENYLMKNILLWIKSIL